MVHGESLTDCTLASIVALDSVDTSEDGKDAVMTLEGVGA